MKTEKSEFNLKVTSTNGTCSTGEETAGQNLDEGKIPVLSCEGACIRGEIARMTANIIAKQEKFGRACHGELFTMPESGMTDWVKRSKYIVLIDGCFLGCHKRVMKNLFDKARILHFDALSIYKKYTDLFESSSVPYSELLETAQNTSDKILKDLSKLI